MFVEAGDDQRALVEVKAALALDPDFLAAQSLRDRILKKSTGRSFPPAGPSARQAPASASSRAAGASVSSTGATRPVVSTPPPSVPVVPIDPIPAGGAAAAFSAAPATSPFAISSVAASTVAPTVAAPSVARPVAAAADLIGPSAAAPVSDSRSSIDRSPTGLRFDPGEVVIRQKPPAAQAPVVSAEGYARFEARAKRRRVDRRIEAARAAMERKRLHEAAVILDEIIVLDPNLPELAALTAEFDELRKAVASPRRGPWLTAAAVFGVTVLGASWLHESSLLVSYPVAASGALISPPSQALTDDIVRDEPPVATAGVHEVQNAVDEPAPTVPVRPRPARSETLPAVLRSSEAPERDRSTASPAPVPVSDVAIPAVGEPPPAPTPAVTPAPPAAPPPASPPPHAVATPAVTAPAPVASAAAAVNTAPPPASAVPTVDDESLVKQTLQRYRHAYEGLDAQSAHAVWPNVDQAALARAFGGLTSQSITFDRCDVQLRGGAAASATCRGTARYVPKIGNREPRVEPRVWNFALKKDGGEWKIDSARAER